MVKIYLRNTRAGTTMVVGDGPDDLTLFFWMSFFLEGLKAAQLSRHRWIVYCPDPVQMCLQHPGARRLLRE